MKTPYLNVFFYIIKGTVLNLDNPLFYMDEYLFVENRSDE